MPVPVFDVEDVTVRFGALTALAAVSLKVSTGERVAVVGPSGAGKSTLLGVLNGTVRPSSGRVRVLGEDLTALGRRQQREIQRRIGTIHQQFDLVGSLRVVHNVNAGRLGQWSLARAAWSLVSPLDVGAVGDALGRVGIPEKLYARTDSLSGGQQQRVAVARVLMQDPTTILADEPISSLDPGRGREVMDLLRDLVVEAGRTLVVSVHAFEYALSHCDRVLGLRAGRVVFDADASHVTPAMAEELYRIDERVANP